MNKKDNSNKDFLNIINNEIQLQLCMSNKNNTNFKKDIIFV